MPPEFNVPDVCVNPGMYDGVLQDEDGPLILGKGAHRCSGTDLCIVPKAVKNI
jgi:hypothetical protein